MPEKVIEYRLAEKCKREISQKSKFSYTIWAKFRNVTFGDALLGLPCKRRVYIVYATETS